MDSKYFDLEEEVMSELKESFIYQYLAKGYGPINELDAHSVSRLFDTREEAFFYLKTLKYKHLMLSKYESIVGTDYKRFMESVNWFLYEFNGDEMSLVE